jgi:curved DNA-binding protein
MIPTVPSVEFQDYYDTLGVSRDASEKDVRAAFRRLARQHHPDVNPGDKAAEERFKQINEAYEVLSDPEKRRRYDELGAHWREYAEAGAQPPPGGAGWTGGPWSGGGTYRTVREEDLEDLFGDASPFSDFFEQYFRGGPSGAERARSPRPRAGADAEAEVEIDVGEAYAGTKRLLSLTGPDGAPRRVEATIPAGVDEGSRIRLAGQGMPGRAGGPSGDLYLVVRVRPDPRFERSGADVRTTVRAPLPTVVLGGTARVVKPDGRALELTIPAGSQDGRVFRLRGQGFPRRAGGSERGDLLAEVHVTLPTAVEGRERELLEELARLHGQRPAAVA